jgi:hypothetical protein
MKTLTRLVVHASLKGGKLAYNAPYMRQILSQYDDCPKVRITLEKEVSLRSERQNRALHRFFHLLSDELNNAGYNIQFVLSKKMDIEWTPETVKELLWRPAQKVILKKKSTTLLKKSEDIDKVYDHINRHIGELFGIHIAFPSYEEGEYEKETSK